MADASSADQKIFKVGIILGLTGPVPELGYATRVGFEAGLDDSTRERMKVIYEDDQFQPSRTVAAFNKLVDIDNVDFIIGIGSSPGQSIAPLAEAKKIPFFTFSGDSTVAINRPHVIRTYTDVGTEVDATAKEVKSAGYRRIGVIVTTTDYPLAYRNALLKQIPEGLVVFNEEVPAQQTDSRSVLVKAVARKIDALFECSIGQQGLIGKQAREVGFSGQIFGCSTFAIPQELARSGGAIKGAWFFTPAINEEVFARLLQRGGKEIDPRVASIHYDLALVLNKVLATISKREELIPAIINYGRFGGALKSCEFRKTGGEQYTYCDVAKYIVGEGIHGGSVESRSGSSS